MKKFFAFLVLALALLTSPRIVSAHAIALACLPRMGINLTSLPTQVICQFNEPLIPASVSMTVTDANGTRVDKNDVRFFENDDHTLVVSLDTEKMSGGLYTVKWRTQSVADQAFTNGEFQFGVNTVVPPTPTAVLPGVVMTPTPIAPQPSGVSDLIPRFLIGVGVVVLIATGVLFWRMRQT